MPTGQDDVFAVSVDTGEILWEYKAHLDQTISRRLLRLGEPRRRARRRARSTSGSSTGSSSRSTRRRARSPGRRRSRAGRTATRSPQRRSTSTAWSITGVSGGEFGIARPPHRLRRDDGQGGLALLHDPRPRRDRPRHVAAERRRLEARRRPGLADAVGRPGARDCSTSRPATRSPTTTAASAPARTSSPRRSSRSTCRPGSSSGTTRWCTTTSGTTTRRARRSSSTPRSTARTCKGIGEAEKTGWLYLLNRETGKPLFPTPEKPVPQEVEPEDVADAAVPAVRAGRPARGLRRAVPGGAEGVDDALEGRAGEGDPRRGDVHALLEDDDGLHAGAAGRHELAAVELQPEHAHVLRLRAERRRPATPQRRAAATKQGDVAQVALGGTLTIAGGFGENTGHLHGDRRDDGQDRLAEEVARVVLRRARRRRRATSSSSAATTASCWPTTRRTANPLWSFQTGAGANDAPTIFEHNGKEYVAFYAGGNALAGSPHGDNLWLFSLDGR